MCLLLAVSQTRGFPSPHRLLCMVQPRPHQNVCPEEPDNLTRQCAGPRCRSRSAWEELTGHPCQTWQAGWLQNVALSAAVLCESAICLMWDLESLVADLKTGRYEQTAAWRQRTLHLRYNLTVEV